MAKTHVDRPASATAAASPALLELFKAAHAEAALDGAMLYELSNIAMLAAFACEARRILYEVDMAADASPDLDRSLSEWVESRNSWIGYDDTAGDVLRTVSERLAGIAANASTRLDDLSKHVERLNGRA